jgi:hypothetical protein
VFGLKCASDEERLDKESMMARGKRYQPELVVNLLRQNEVAVANGKTAAQVVSTRRS